MPFFSHPLWLLLALPSLFLLWRIQRRTFSDAGRTKLAVWLALRSAVLILVIFALAGLHWERRSEQREILFLLDASRSLAAEEQQKEINAINSIIKNLSAHDKAGVITFGSQAYIERFPAAPFPIDRIESQIDPEGTNLENAARLADALFTPSYEKSLVVLSDGRDNQGNPEEIFHRLKEKGVAVQALFFLPPVRIEANIERAAFPDEVRLKEPFDIEVVTNSNRVMPAVVQIFQNGALIQEATVMLSATEKRLFRFPQKIEEPGIFRYEVQLKPQQDSINENNTQAGWVSVEGPPRILLVDSEPTELQAFRDWLSQRGFHTDLKSPQYFPTSLESLLNYQAVILRNVPASAIHSAMPLIRDYVHEYGGGLAMLGGEQSFGPGGYFDTPVEAALPVRMDLTNKKYLADVAMAIVIDKSGSMSYAERGRQKIDLADEGAARVASFLKKSDQLGVLAVDSVPKWVYELQQLTDQPRAVEAITSIRAGGGGIYVYSGLREAYDRLRMVKAPVKHVILFADSADCEEKDGPSGDSSLSLAQRALRDDKITTTTIGIGRTGDADVEFLRQVAGLGEGRFYFTTDMFTLPEIFAQESTIVQRYYITEEKFTPRLVQPDPLLAGISSIPDLHGYIATSAKPLATVNLISHRQDPILACWQYGLGRAVAFTSDPATAWASDWNQWNEAQRVWSQIGHYLTQDTSPAHFRTSAFSENGITTIVLEALDEQNRYLNSAEFAGALLDSAGRNHRLDFEQTGPGRYEGKLSLARSAIGKIVRIENGRIAEQALLQVPGGLSREFDTQRDGKARLKELTGRVLDSLKEVRFGKGSAQDLLPLQNQLLVIASILFVLDVAARKIDFRTVFRSQQKQPEPVLAGSTQLTALMQRKTSAGKFRKTHGIDSQAFENRSTPASNSSDIQRDAEAKAAGASNYIDRLKEAKKRRK